MWKEIEPGSSWRVSDQGEVKHGPLLHIRFKKDDEWYVKIRGEIVNVAQLMVAVFHYGDLSTYGICKISYKDHDRTNCTLGNLYVRSDTDIDIIREAAPLCSNTKEMLGFVQDKGVSITARELRDIKKEHGIRCGKRRPGTLTYEGETKTYQQWAFECGMREETLRKRLSRGWSLEKTLNYPVKKAKVDGMRVGG
jgi:hypothetical protein